MGSIHQTIVQFPIVLLTSSLLFAFLALAIPSNGITFSKVFKWNLFLGVLASLAALISGISDLKNLAYNEVERKLISVHEKQAYIVTSIFLIISLWIIIRKTNLKAFEIKSIVIIMAVTVFVLIYVAYLGDYIAYLE